jgi:adenosine kinase
MQTKYIIGLGSPLLDMQAEVPMEFLTKYDLSLNNTFFAEPKHMPLYEELLTQPNFSKVPGGASLNTLRMAQWMAQGTPE